MLKTFYQLIITGLCVLALGCDKSETETKAPVDKVVATEPLEIKAAAISQTVAAQTLEVGCGGCIFNMEGAQGCQLAAKIDGKAYLVSGASFDAHSTGLCSASKQADVAGTIKDGKFVVTKMELK
jgi:hypothetical protein